MWIRLIRAENVKSSSTATQSYRRRIYVTARCHWSIDVQVASCYTPAGRAGLYVSGRSRARSATDGRAPVYHTGTDGGQNLPVLIISSAAVHSCVPETSGLRRPDVFCVRQNVKHFDVFMTASVRLASSLPRSLATTDRPCVQRRHAVYCRITLLA